MTDWPLILMNKVKLTPKGSFWKSLEDATHTPGHLKCWPTYFTKTAMPTVGWSPVWRYVVCTQDFLRCQRHSLHSGWGGVDPAPLKGKHKPSLSQGRRLLQPVYRASPLPALCIFHIFSEGTGYLPVILLSSELPSFLRNIIFCLICPPPLSCTFPSCYI